MTDHAVYKLAQTARTKLCLEGSRSDHNLRRILGHANMLDSLTVELKTLGYEFGSGYCSEEEEFYDEDATIAEVEPPLGQCRLDKTDPFCDDDETLASPDFSDSDAGSDSSSSWESSDFSDSTDCSESEISDEEDDELYFVENSKRRCDEIGFCGEDTQITVQEISGYD